MNNPERPAIRRAWSKRGGLVVVFVFLAITIAQFVLSRQTPHHGDLVTYRHASHCLFESPDSSIYAAAPDYVYPLFLAIVLRVFEPLPQSSAGFVWDIGRYASFGFALLVCHRLLRRDCDPGRAAGVVLVCLLASVRPMWHDTVHGNVNALLLLGVALGWAAMSRQKPATAGGFWSLVAAVKPSSAAVLLAPMAGGRRGLLRCWIVAFGSLVLVNIVLPIAILGRESTWTQLQDFSRGVMTTPVFDKHGNHSLGIGFTRVVAHLAGHEPGDAPVREVGVVGVVGCVGVVCWALALLAWLNRTARSGGSDHAVCVCCLLSVLLSPLVWYSHYLLLVPVYALLLREALAARQRWMRAQLLVAVSFASIVINGQATILGTISWAPLVLLMSLTLLLLCGTPLKDTRTGRVADEPLVSSPWRCRGRPPHTG